MGNINHVWEHWMGTWVMCKDQREMCGVHRPCLGTWGMCGTWGMLSVT